MFLYVCAFLVATMVVRGQYPTNERYIILLEKGSDAGDIEELIQSMEVHASSTREEMQVRSLTSLLPFVIGNMSEATAEMVSKLANVELIEKDQVVHPDRSIEQDDSPILEDFDTNRINLDILDNVNCIDGTFKPDNYGLGADIYIVDTGINYDHIDFRWRNGDSGSRAKIGFDVIDDHYGTTDNGRDHRGHGTHCAGIAGGVDSGVAKDANLYSVRVFGDPPNYGTWATAIAGVDYVGKAHNENSKRKDFVGTIASLSIGGFSDAADRAAQQLWDLGVVTVCSSGNRKIDGCDKTFCRIQGIICVGAHGYDENTCDKKMYVSSNYGPCVDVMAPGINILSASITNNNGYTEKTGTSMACPHVSGVAALMKTADPTLSPAEIRQKIMDNAVDDIDRSDMPPNVQETSHSKRLFVSPDLFH